MLGIGIGRWRIIHVGNERLICKPKDFPAMHPLTDTDTSIIESIMRWARTKIYAPLPNAQSESALEFEEEDDDGFEED